MIDKSIFREYDIRGIIDQNLNEKAVRLIARAYGSHLYKKSSPKNQLTISIGMDARVSSEKFFKIMADEFSKIGINVIGIGLCPTPLLYYSLFSIKDLDGGVMITGSHNPPEYNGFKICVGKDTIYGEEIQELYQIIINNKMVSDREQKGDISYFDIKKSYIDYITKQFSHLNGCFKQSIVIDAGNGVGNLVAPKILRNLGFNVIDIFSEPDGNFPNHHPDPTVEKNLETLKKRVLESNAILGIGYDGDADRIGAIDENANIIWGDQLMILYSRDILENSKGAKIIGEVKCSQTMYDDIAKNGGIPIMWRTGHSLIKNKLKDEKAAIAGEMSGHIFFADRYFGYDDAIYATLRLVEIICKKKVKLSQLLQNIPKTFITEEIRFNCPEDKKFSIPEKLKALIIEDKTLKNQIKDIITIDGVRIIFEDGWGLVRASNTQSVLVMRFEGNSLEKRDFYRTVIENKLQILMQN